MLAEKVVQQSKATAVKQRALVVAEPVQKIEHRILLNRLLMPARVIAGREIDAVVHFGLQNSAVDRIAIDPALRSHGGGNNQNREK